MGSQAVRFRAPSWTIAAFGLAIAWGAFFWSRVDFSDRTVPGGDTCVYMLLARSLKDHGDFRTVWTVGERPHGQLSPGFPALLVPFLTGSGMDVAAVRGLMVSLVAGSIFLIFLLFRSSGEPLAFAVALFTGANALIFLYGRSMLSELPYLFLSLAALWLWERYERREQRSWPWEAWLAFTLAAAFLMRSGGLCLMLAVFIRASLVPGQGGVRGLLRRPFLFWLPVAVVVWWLSRQVIVSQLSAQNYYHEFWAGDEGGGTVLLQLGERWLRGIYALLFYAMPQALANVRFSGRSAGAFLLMAVCCYGLWRAFWDSRRAVDMYVALYLAAAAFWPWVQTSGARYVTPFVPFLLYYFFYGCGELVRWGEKKPWVPMAVFAVVAVWAVAYGIHSPLTRMEVPSVSMPDQRAVLYRWVRDNVPADAVVASFDPAAMFFHTGRKAPDIPVTTIGRRELAALLQAGQAGWLVEDTRLKESRTVVGAILSEGPSLLRLEFQAGPYRVYRPETQR